MLSIACYLNQVATYKEDFLQERKDREKTHAQMEEQREQSAVMIKDLRTEIQNLKTGASATAEDFQISQSQIIAYKKQLDACKKELEDERRRGQVMQGRIDALNALQEQMNTLKAEVCFCVLTTYFLGCTCNESVLVSECRIEEKSW